MKYYLKNPTWMVCEDFCECVKEDGNKVVRPNLYVDLKSLNSDSSSLILYGDICNETEKVEEEKELEGIGIYGVQFMEIKKKDFVRYDYLKYDNEKGLHIVGPSWKIGARKVIL